VLDNNGILRKTLLSREKLTGGWRKLFNEELRDLDYSSNITRMIKSRRMR
jgi:hypothetical protein